VRVLNINVPVELLNRWVEWFAPDIQPFRVPPKVADSCGFAAEPDRLTPELRDTFWLWGLSTSSVLVWLTRAEARRLPVEVRRSQPAAHHWPHTLAERNVAAVVRYVERGARPSRHRDVTAATWRRAADALPNARRLGGRFAEMSGPNCFGTVMAACGVEGVEDEWILREPFEEWLTQNTAKGGRDDEPGTVFVWRDGEDLVQHAAVTIGDGWALHKPSQGWMSPSKMLTVQDLKSSARVAGNRLHKHCLR
jgi:hypothetical protein